MEAIIEIQEFCDRMSRLVDQQLDPGDPETLVGAFQKLRPDCQELEPLFELLPGGAPVFERLEMIYRVAGDPRRPDGMKDAFFVVRNPVAVEPGAVRRQAERYWNALATLAFEQGQDSLAGDLNPLPEIRVKEGDPPKHPKVDAEKCSLLRAVQGSGPQVTSRCIEGNRLALFFQQAFYFLACDSSIRDFLVWPWIEKASNVEDPFSHYFEIWKCGGKFRIFNNRQIDLYLPRFF